ncbi:MAG: glutathione synthase [Pseudomonadota bacterium]
MSKPIAALQMDPLEDINIDGDSSFVLGLEAVRRGYQLFHYGVDSLCYDHGKITARGAFVTLQRVVGAHFLQQTQTTLDLSECRVILMRQDPPFDMQYIAATHLLEQVGCLVVNDPVAVRNAPEKLLVTHFHDLMPPSMITRDQEALRAFRHIHGAIIVKPLFGNGGVGVFYLQKDDANFDSLIEMMLANSREQIMAQKFIPRVVEGDKRIILVDGKIGGAINRVPQSGQIRSNMHVGGQAVACVLDARDHEICERLHDILLEQNLIFTGIDIIDGYLTEINVTSPTGLQEVARFGGPALERDIWDAIEERL